MKQNEITETLEPLLEIFNELNISYYISGSIASSAYGISRATRDIDIVSDIPDTIVRTLVERLKNKYFIDEGMIREAILSQSSFNLIHLETMLKIDIFILKDESYYQNSFERKVKDTIGFGESSVTVYLSTPEDIILSKLQWYKAGGEVSEHQWLDVLGVIKVQQGNLDMSYLKFWAKDLNISVLLLNAFDECGFKI